jgi:hypothetical protein
MYKQYGVKYVLAKQVSSSRVCVASGRAVSPGTFAEEEGEAAVLANEVSARLNEEVFCRIDILFV